MPHRDPMRLELPTDELILQHLAGGRNLAANIAAEIDRARNYVNRRMGYLHDYGLVRRIGPVEGTGLYEITERGAAALAHIDAYQTADDFERLVEDGAKHIEIRPMQIIDHRDDVDETAGE